MSNPGDEADVVRLERRGAVAVIRLDNGPLNLLTRVMRARLAELGRDLAQDPGVRAVVLCGGARAFSVGSDVKEFPPDAATGLELARGEHAACQALERMPQPVIAALEGYILGGGLELAVACDLRVAAETSTLGMPEVSLGVFPGECAESLPRLVGPTAAKLLMLRGEPISAAEAWRIGLVDELAPSGGALDAALRMAQRIAGHPAAAVRAIKAAIDDGARAAADQHRAAQEQTQAQMFETHDAQEAVRAFLEKRQPVFRHR
jgi:enoyl-CoA hydratase